jgi:hypothetical protein
MLFKKKIVFLYIVSDLFVFKVFVVDVVPIIGKWENFGVR